MRHSARFRLFLVLGLALPVGCATQAAEIQVESQQAFRDAVSELNPGDTIVLANGEWRDFEILFDGEGEPDRPISLVAETKGNVFITGRSNLRLAGSYLHVSGLVFKDGHSPTNTVISFRRTKGKPANHSRVSEVVIDHFNNPERHETDFWVMMYGKNNRFDHNHLVGKSNVGVTMAVRLDSEASQNNHHRIDHNYFGPRPVLGSNGGETLRIGTSKYSLTDSHTLVENNFFDRCNGEVEIVSSKSGGNIFRGNVFFESRGTLTLRHGNGNLIENNVFLGNGVDHTGGIRVINKRQTVRNNYLSGLTGYRFGGALVVMNGVPDSPINRYHQVEDAVIERNTIINSDHIELAAGSDAERSAVPMSTVFRANLIVNEEEKDSIAVHDDISGIRFVDNVATGVAVVPDPKGMQVRDVSLQRAENGLLYPVAPELQEIGAPRTLTVLDREATGVSWYEKLGYGGRFGTGKVHQVSPGPDTLTAAMDAAAAGDTIELAAGDYLVSKILELDRPVTVRGASEGGALPTIRYERSALFELKDGGSLQLKNLAIEGSQAPDAYGNAVIRTSRYSMLGNYQILLEGLAVSSLNTNHSFDFIKVASHTFADDISIKNSSFRDVTGHILALDRETDDLGIYNGEYISITNSRFANVGKSVASIYRGGTDESTFGPHFTLANSELENIGKSKRNKTRASLLLHGVQVTNIHGNSVSNSRPVKVIETVGEPQTKLAANQFQGTPEPIVRDIKELDQP